MAYILCVCFLLGCKKKEDSNSFIPDTNASARSELDVFGPPGKWIQRNELIDSKGVTNISTSATYVRHALNGHFILFESDVIAGFGSKQNFVVKHFDASASTNRYRSTWFSDDGSVQIFEGNWDAGMSKMSWTPLFPLLFRSGSSAMKFSMSEIYIGIEKKILNIEMLTKTNLVSRLKSVIKYAGDASNPNKKTFFNPTPEMARFGRAGIWEETQTVELPDGTKIKMKGRSRMHWSRSGKELINEGALFRPDGTGKPEHFMWIKTWSPEQRLYRYLYFFEDGPVHHYTGMWESVSDSVLWRSAYTPGRSIKIRESLRNSKNRQWTMTATEEGIITFGSGASRFVE
jgi:hypothetical protein|tara:strand:+ start:193 stop:1227 length:1035 start_codon:yes stop_codon:yes gene_type:complete